MRVVVVGASVAGVTAAEALRAEGHDGELVLVGDEAHAPYVRPPLSKQVLDGTWSPDRAALRSAAALDALDVDRRTGRADALDLAGRRITVDGERMAYDTLIVATGVRAVRPAGIPGIEHARVLRTLDDGVALRDALTGAEHVVVIGAGVLASELASAARHLDRRVTVVGRSGAMGFGTVGPLLSDRLEALHRAHGVALSLSDGPRAVVAADGGRHRVVLASGRTVDADLVVAATGGRPATDWLRGSGLLLDDGVCCDVDGRALLVDGSRRDDIFAIGDVSRRVDPVTGASSRVEHQTNAIEQGLAVARTVVGGTPLPSATPFFWSEVHGVRIQAYGTFAGGALTPLEDVDGRAVLAASERGDGHVTGVVGWHAAKAFRTARALVDDARRLREAARRPGGPDPAHALVASTGH